jgi:hypothetical protein
MLTKTKIQSLFFTGFMNKKTATNTENYRQMHGLLPFWNYPYINRLEFTNRLLESKKEKPYTKLSKMDEKCLGNNIEHRLTKPFTPKTNEITEYVNGTIKKDTILVKTYAN